MFKSIVRYDGTLVAAVAALPGGTVRFFVMQKRETPDLFIGRISRWIKEHGGTDLEMQEPEVLPEGIDVGEVLLRIRSALNIDREAPDAAEYEIGDAELVWLQSLGPRKPN
jgi:hypothetical protein